ncbi:hypothetical protein [Novosphingobium gossypii]|uniref:hypothetical protein n=1 Tax=Novosphingobium gossypii TaxID=1604774 RepID=UPI003D1A1163
MWEWLRRDSGYIAWHVKASRATTGSFPDPSAWGVHFCRKSGPGRPLGPGPVACRIRPWNTCVRSGPGRDLLSRRHAACRNGALADRCARRQRGRTWRAHTRRPPRSPGFA